MTRKLQNAAAHMLLGKPEFHRATPLLQELHCLPTVFQSQFKVLVITYTVLNGLGPGYLKDRLLLHISAQHLHSLDGGLYQIPPATEALLMGT